MTVQLADGRTIFVEGGQVVREDELSEHLVDKLKDGGPHYESLFDSANQKDYEEQETVNSQHFDPALQQAAEAEELSRQRANFSRDDRFGNSPPEQVPIRLDAGRTLPESGADTVAARRFGEGNFEGKDRAAQLEELGVEPGEVAPAQDDAMPREPMDLEEVPEPVKSESAGSKAGPAMPAPEGTDRKSKKD
jgi:hypothetical protein